MDSFAKPADTLSRSDRSLLRIGVMIDRQQGLENWQSRIIDRILADSRFAPVSVLVCPPSIATAKPSRLLRLAAALERIALARQPAYLPQHFDPAALPFRQVALGRGDGVADGQAPLADISDLKLDLVLSLTSGELPERMLAGLRFGEWRFSFSAEASEGTDWSGYAGVIENRPATEMRIDIRRGDPVRDANLVAAAFNTKFSAIRNADFIKERAVTLVMRELRRVADTGRIEPSADRPTHNVRSAPPSGSQLLRYGWGLASELLARSSKAVQAKFGGGAAVWALYVGQGSPRDFDPRQSVLIEPDKDEIRADPFLLEHEGEIYLFYEAYAPGDGKAHIAVSRLVGNRVERLGIALNCEHHLSYPFIFRHDGQLFMMPETNQARRLEIWRCVEFPLRWELHSTALEGLSSADSTLTLYNGRWWLLTNLSDFHAYEDHCSELHIFEVDGPDLKTVVAHRNNPVVIDSTTARNGGRPFVEDGKLYRPSQRNEFGVYGYGLNIMEIEQLDLDRFQERCVRTITPDFSPGLVACHHLDAAGGRYVIDAMRGRARQSPQ
ncbi:hypothetical protein PDO_4534 [Rhizobium sp. PDO1-076]|uniref:glucosamine inositolphosphorylceramide transferase family protein n=1 Tax=Rhizobium sp. PDO1-076 TaxID=1125979 RepID=UPI00024E2EA1|nr:hypothetical protein [Rhizobium sp. PDO1-076]EHS52911.1 hypothetical protein PDO_4534 [Rhizobium sp. PDO1-076]